MHCRRIKLSKTSTPLPHQPSSHQPPWPRNNPILLQSNVHQNVTFAGLWSSSVVGRSLCTQNNSRGPVSFITQSKFYRREADTAPMRSRWLCRMGQLLLVTIQVGTSGIAQSASFFSSQPMTGRAGIIPYYTSRPIPSSIRPLHPPYLIYNSHDPVVSRKRDNPKLHHHACSSTPYM